MKGESEDHSIISREELANISIGISQSSHVKPMTIL